MRSAGTRGAACRLGRHHIEVECSECKVRRCAGWPFANCDGSLTALSYSSLLTSFDIISPYL